MAIFASTTTSGYSDPLKAYTLKALEKRQADLLAQQAQATMPDAIPTPIQGFGHLANQIGGQMQQARADQALAARRDELTRVMAGLDLNNPDPKAMATIASADPDTYKTLLQTWAENRRARENREFQGGENKAQRDLTAAQGDLTRKAQHDLATDAQRARADEAVAQRNWEAGQKELDRADKAGDRQATIAAQENLVRLKADLDAKAEAAKPYSDRGKTERDINTGLIPPDQAAAARAGEVKPKVAEAIATTTKAYTQSQNAVNDLKRARDAFKGGIYEGAMQNIAPGASTIPGSGYIIDKEKAQRTALVNNVLSKIATGTMAETLKGSSTNYEMQKFDKIFNDPAISPKDKQIAFDNLIKIAEADLATEGEQLGRLGGSTERVDKTMAPGASGAPAAAADPMEGRIIRNDKGEEMIRRNGQWVAK